MRGGAATAIRLRGRIVSGIGDGAKYVSIYRDVIRKKLGIEPYPGTLNIDVGANIYRRIAELEPIVIPPPSDNYRLVLAYPARLIYNGRGVDGYIVIPCATVHPGNIIEFIAPICLRKSLGLRDNDIVDIWISSGNRD